MTGRRSLLAFLSLAFAGSWSCWLAAALLQERSPAAASALSTIGGFGPSLAAVVVVGWAGGRAALQRWFGRCLRWRIGKGPLVWAFLLPLVVLAPAALVAVALGGHPGVSPALENLPLAAVNLGLILLLGGPLGEEFGWRGYAWFSLRSRHGWRIASLILGGVWGLWHLPLFFITGTVQHRVPALLFLASTIALSVVFGWLSERSQGSLLPALLLHASVNWWAWVIPGLLAAGNEGQRAAALGLLLLLAIGLMAWPQRLSARQ